MTHYTNPVFSEYFADPYILQHDGLFYAYGTAPASSDGMQFRVLRSPDLIAWEPIGWALPPLPGATSYWAPEVVARDGRFVMYYSAGVGDSGHQIRAAISDHPGAPFRPIGDSLTPDLAFAIDAHPFQDADGTWYLYYARDFLTLDGDERVGTGIVVDRMIDALTLAGMPQIVVRPHADWQLFQAGRAIYGAVYDWHTIEGAAVRMHNGRIYCFYSGGAWERDNYGVSYVVADHPLGSYTRPPQDDARLLRSVPGRVRGPGHHSFLTLENGDELIVYHAWDEAMTARLLRIDPFGWRGDQPVTPGPTWTPQPAPRVHAPVNAPVN
ncbi:MAG: glycoside hydrolase family 43 protein, partial [Chloroflexota bacterium]|nr:glycoside hydrolase family 43 protein [Chloroflexota bacterium]